MTSLRQDILFRSTGICLLTFCLFLAGCSHHPELARLKTVPVRGQITLDGQPLPKGEGSISCVWMGENLGVDNWGVSGSIDQDGSYTLHTGLGLNHGYTGLLAQKSGAPPGRYAVEVRLYEKFDPEHHNWKNPQRSLLPQRYARSHESGLTLEVVDNPAQGAYDFKLTTN